MNDQNLKRATTDMNRKTAENLMTICMGMNDALNQFATAVEGMADSEDRTELRKGVAETATEIYISLMRPIIRRYPDLDPDADEPGKVQ